MTTVASVLSHYDEPDLGGYECTRKISEMDGRIYIKITYSGKMYRTACDMTRKGDIFVELSLVPKKRKPKPNIITENIVDRSLELTDPTPNLQHLFASLDAGHFAGLLTKNHVEVKWGTIDGNATGLCYTYESREQKDDKRIVIELNEQLLKFRTRRDLVETLLHEMIHAFLSIKDSCDDHGTNFRKEMDRINAETGATVSIHHQHHNEVALYESRLWRCNGICRKRSPQFGLIRIETGCLVDFEDQWWWSYHLKNCGGTFELVPVPEESALKTKWVNLRRSFRNQLKKILKSVDNVYLINPHNVQSTWRYYQAMLFLVHRVRVAQQNQFLQVAVTEPVARNANAKTPNVDTVIDTFTGLISYKDIPSYQFGLTRPE
ncbi:hypothetical protein HA402_001249 [Bradysia odoriphaga]|nr:hypothetical protein HA402_001249 [Bradysia odoriphaga]